jgi:hypothetical protein
VVVPRTSKPKARAAAPSAASCVTISGNAPTRSRQIRAVARWMASSVPIGIGIGSPARLNTGGRSSTKSTASSHSFTAPMRAAASSIVSAP